MLSVLVPFRDSAGHRARLWAYVRSTIEHDLPEAEIIEASDDGADPFNKSQAVNAAARLATGDVFCIWDSDCLIPADQVRLAVQETATGWAKPWRRKLRVTEAETERILAHGWDGRAQGLQTEHVNAFWAAPPLVLTREMFYDVGQMDERYRGWGGEDAAFARALWKIGHGLPVSVPGVTVHLWHPRIGRHGADEWEGQTGIFPNRDLDKEYTRARTPEQVRALIAARGEG